MHTGLERLELNELLRLAYVEINPLSSTAMELELLRRLEEGERAHDDIDGVLSDFGVSDPEDRDHVTQLSRALRWERDWEPKLYEPLLVVCSENDIDDAKQLTKLLTRLDELERQLEDGELVPATASPTDA